MKKIFKQCTSCEKVWNSREKFLSDPDVELTGYQVNYNDLEAGLFLFTHLETSCGTTFALTADHFTDMHKGPMFYNKPEDISNCPGYCNDGSLRRCLEKCECSYVTDVTDQVKNWPKSVPLHTS